MLLVPNLLDSAHNNAFNCLLELGGHFSDQHNVLAHTLLFLLASLLEPHRANHTQLDKQINCVFVLTISSQVSKFYSLQTPQRHLTTPA